MGCARSLSGKMTNEHIPFCSLVTFAVVGREARVFQGSALEVDSSITGYTQRRIWIALDRYVMPTSIVPPRSRSMHSPVVFVSVNVIGNTRLLRKCPEHLRSND
jgi:hypothetical protein